jgi:hypothetical protein
MKSVVFPSINYNDITTSAPTVVFSPPPRNLTGNPASLNLGNAMGGGGSFGASMSAHLVPPPLNLHTVNTKTFPTVLNFNDDDTSKTSIDGKKLLFVLDNTGSMGEMINYADGISKGVAAKKLIEQILSKRPTNDYDVMVFNDKPYPVVKVADITMPNGVTFFSPLVDEIKKVVTTESNYCSVIFLSDGQPSEPMDIAHNAIRAIGNTTREMHCNPVSVAIGHDADGSACALFAGNRGFNCFINEMKNLEEVAKDINHGVDCKYKMLENGQFIPIEADGKYYFVGSEVVGATVAPNKFLIEKYLNLVIMQHINDYSMLDPINKLVACCSKMVDDETEQKAIIDRFHKIIHVVKQNIVHNGSTPAFLSSGGAVYRAASQQV